MNRDELIAKGANKKIDCSSLVIEIMDQYIELLQKHYQPPFILMLRHDVYFDLCRNIDVYTGISSFQRLADMKDQTGKVIFNDIRIGDNKEKFNLIYLNKGR